MIIQADQKRDGSYHLLLRHRKISIYLSISIYDFWITIVRLTGNPGVGSGLFAGRLFFATLPCQRRAISIRFLALWQQLCEFQDRSSFRPIHKTLPVLSMKERDLVVCAPRSSVCLARSFRLLAAGTNILIQYIYTPGKPSASRFTWLTVRIVECRRRRKESIKIFQKGCRAVPLGSMLLCSLL